MKKSKILKIILLALLLLLILAVAVSLIKYFTGYEIYRDVKYSSGELNVMDVYLPKSAYERDKNGLVLFIHGGSWVGGDKSEESGRCRLLASHGYIVASVNYTLWSEENADTYNVSQVLDELDTALFTLKEFAAERGITIDKAATTGYSAGAHLAMLYAFSRSESAPLDIVFTASMAGPADMSSEVWGDDLTIGIIERLTGEKVTRDMLSTTYAEEIVASVSPSFFVNEASVPTLLVHGGRDDVVPIANAESLIARLEEYSVKHDYIYMKDSNHSLIQNPIGRLRYFRKLIEYCKEYFGY